MARPLAYAPGGNAGRGLLVLALIVVPLALFALGASFGSAAGAIGVSIWMFAVAALLIGAEVAVLLNPHERPNRVHIALRHVRTAQLRRMADGDAGETGPAATPPDLRRRIGELRNRLSSPVGSGFGMDPIALSLLMLGMFLLVMAQASGSLLGAVANDRYLKAVAQLDPASATYNADMQAALATMTAAVRHNTPLLIAGILVWLSLTAAALARSTLLRHRIRRRFESLACPDCGYGLLEAEHAIAPERLGGILSGPAACPECGSPWPLIPPPTRQEMLTEAAWRAPVKPRRWSW